MLREIEKKYSVIKQLSKCFIDNRNQEYVKHPLQTLLTQRIFGLCQGYEDLNDHGLWRSDPLLALACEIDTDKIAAGKSTLNRLEPGKEITEEYGDRYNKISWDDKKIARQLKRAKKLYDETELRNNNCIFLQTGLLQHG